MLNVQGVSLERLLDRFIGMLWTRPMHIENDKSSCKPVYIIIYHYITEHCLFIVLTAGMYIINTNLDRHLHPFS